MNSTCQKAVKISIVIPCYNAEEFIEETIQSCLDQSFQDFEIIVVDDGSTDDSVKVLEGLSLQHTEIKLFKQENFGSCTARNYGMDMSQGEYLFFLDADDILEHNALSSLFEMIGDADAVYGDAYTFSNANLEDRKKVQKKYSPILKELSVVIEAPLCGTVLMNRAAIKTRWKSDFNYVDEFYFFAKHASLGTQFRKAEVYVLNYRQHYSTTRKTSQIKSGEITNSLTKAYLEIYGDPLCCNNDLAKSVFSRIFLTIFHWNFPLKHQSDYSILAQVAKNIGLVFLIKSFFNKDINYFMSAKRHLIFSTELLFWSLKKAILKINKS